MTVELTACAGRTRLRLAHSGFADEESRNAHEQAWPTVLAQLDRRLTGLGADAG